MNNQPTKLPTRILTGHPDTPVKVALQCDDQRPKDIWILVSVGSNTRPGLFGHLKINPNNPQEKIREDVRRAAEAIAAQQCLSYRDIHNPPAVGKAAVEALNDVFAVADRANKKIISIPKAPTE